MRSEVWPTLSLQLVNDVIACRYDKFAFDITDALEKGQNGVHELAIRVFDPTGVHLPPLCSAQCLAYGC